MTELKDFMSEAPAVTAHRTAQDEYEYPSIWYRFLGNFLDGIFVSILTAPLSIVNFIIGFSAGTNAANHGSTKVEFTTAQLTIIMLMTLASLVVSMLYSVLFTASKWQGTPAKKILGFKVISTSGGKISYGQAFARFALLTLPGSVGGFFINAPSSGLKVLGYSLMFLAGVYIIVLAIIVSNDKQVRMIHDRVAKTLVVKK
jgi:uncharacterized RDD family membrane protein YckC